ncbi:MAG: hypothetical protein QM783_09465 [Phycisphaerales bacterium]
MLLNDLSLLQIPGADEPTVSPQEEPRLATGDLVVRVGPTGQLDASGSARPERTGPAGRLAAGGAGVSR